MLAMRCAIEREPEAECTAYKVLNEILAGV
jgi:hypothetical protein